MNGKLATTTGPIRLSQDGMALASWTQRKPVPSQRTGEMGMDALFWTSVGAAAGAGVGVLVGSHRPG